LARRADHRGKVAYGSRYAVDDLVYEVAAIRGSSVDEARDWLLGREARVPSIGEVIEAFQDGEQNAGWAAYDEATRRDYARTLGWLVEEVRKLPQGLSTRVDEVPESLFLRLCETPRDLARLRADAYRTNRMAGDRLVVSNNTFSRRLSALKALARFVREHHRVEMLGVARLRTRQGSGHGEELTPEEIRRLEAYIDGHPRGRLRNLAIFKVFLHSGLRREELASLFVGSIDWEERLAHLPVFKGQKSGSECQVAFIGKPGLDALRAYLEAEHGPGPWDPKAPLFRSERGGRLSPDGIAKLVDAWFEGAGVKKPGRGCHVFRHTFAKWIYRVSGYDLVATQHALRHKRLTTTEVYLRHLSRELRDMVDRVGRALADVLEEELPPGREEALRMLLKEVGR
jgi:integrase